MTTSSPNHHSIFFDQIRKKENDKRVAISKKYKFLLPIILNTRRFLNWSIYTLNPNFDLNNKQDTSKWLNLAEHSSPLYRKFNKVELDEGKIENIKIAIQKLNGLVIPPGKTFSLWKHIGKPNEKRGFKKGLVLSDGKLKEDIGGGLCQLSNLIAYMFACTECEFIEREHHSRDVFPDSGRIIPFASGATVFYNLIDLKVKNNYSFPIKINLHVTDTQLRGSLSSTSHLDYFIKLEERNQNFIKSVKSGIVYRCNELYRVFYQKNTKEKIKEKLLWRNTAKVVYDHELIKEEIKNLK